MPRLEEHLLRQAAQERTEETLSSAEQRAALAAEIGKRFAIVARLAESADVAWLIEHGFGPLIAAEQDAALDVKLPIAERGDHAQRLDMAKILAGWVAAEHLKLSLQLRGLSAPQ